MRAALEAAQRQQEEARSLWDSQQYVFSKMSLCNTKQMSSEKADKNTDRSGEEESCVYVGMRECGRASVKCSQR